MISIKSGRLWNIFQGKKYYQPLSWEEDLDHDWTDMSPELLTVFQEFLAEFEAFKTAHSSLEMSLTDANNLIVDAYRKGQTMGW